MTCLITWRSLAALFANATVAWTGHGCTDSACVGSHFEEFPGDTSNSNHHVGAICHAHGLSATSGVLNVTFVKMLVTFLQVLVDVWHNVCLFVFVCCDAVLFVYFMTCFINHVFSKNSNIIFKHTLHTHSSSDLKSKVFSRDVLLILIKSDVPSLSTSNLKNDEQRMSKTLKAS